MLINRFVRMMHYGENRPIDWTCGATNIVMKYDRMGRRVEYLETVADDSTISTNKHQRFVYDNYLCVERHSVTNGITALTDVFVWDPTEPVATRPLQWQTSSDTYLYFHDGNKNVTDVVSVSAAADIAHYDYAPFGESDSFVETEANPWMFSSEYVDVTVATMYYNYRHYDLLIGRWLTTDPFVNSKLYNFVSNAPLIIFDTLGAYGNPVSGPNGPVGPSGPYEPSGCMDSTSLRADCDKLENELLLMCPNIGATYRTAWGSCCCGLDCREQAKQIADSVYDIVSQMQSEVVTGGWIGNLFSYFGHGYGCVDWQKAVVDAVNDSIAADSSCFKGIGVGSFYPFTELTMHNWTKIFGPDTPYLLNTYIQHSNGVEIDPWPSGGRNIFPESFRDIDKPTYWK